MLKIDLIKNNRSIIRKHHLMSIFAFETHICNLPPDPPGPHVAYAQYHAPAVHSTCVAAAVAHVARGCDDDVPLVASQTPDRTVYNNIWPGDVCASRAAAVPHVTAGRRHKCCNGSDTDTLPRRCLW